MHLDFFGFAKETLETEIREAQRMLARLDNSIELACQLLLKCKGKVVVSGMGKSGHIGKKIAASLASTGTPAFFVHPAEALHGDLGMIDAQDVVVFISYSGRAHELDTILPLIADNGIPVIAMTGDLTSPLAKGALCVLDVGVEREACPMGLAPTASSVNTLMMGDALAMAVMRFRGFSAEQFAHSHPGGSLGSRLLKKVHHIMRRGEWMPIVARESTITDALLELSRTGLGLIAICDKAGRVVGVFTDGDLRRWLIQKGSLDASISEAMTQPGFVLSANMLAANALDALHEHHINAAPVVDDDGKVVGAINLYDFHQAGIK
ncbi:arabinose-5-phosphate isomerase GutQ [Pantoea sp. B65]|uniref:arabinose-5-phosphate isomerase GutQ n=1 Tax=Pantoea sp. B65 TaxID=2813359 RepID=UPI0039B6E1F6